MNAENFELESGLCGGPCVCVGLPTTTPCKYGPVRMDLLVDKLKAYELLAEIWRNAEKDVRGAYYVFKEVCYGLCPSISMLYFYNRISSYTYNVISDDILEYRYEKHIHKNYLWPHDEVGKNDRIAFCEDKIEKLKTKIAQGGNTNVS